MPDLKFSSPTQRNSPQREERWPATPPSLTGSAASVVVAQPVPQPVVPAGRRHVQLVLALLLFCIGSYFLVSRFVMTPVVVEGRSMYPTLRDGDRCFLDRWSYHYRDPRRGDLVVIRDPGHRDYAVKRVVAMPGEKVELRDGAVFLNGARLDEPYLLPGAQTLGFGSVDQYVQLGENQYFVLGDNREHSEDSRFYGPLDRGSIIGLISVSD